MIPKGKINQGSRLSLTSQNRIRSKIEEEESNGVQNNEQSHFLNVNTDLNLVFVLQQV